MKRAWRWLILYPWLIVGVGCAPSSTPPAGSRCADNGPPRADVVFKNGNVYTNREPGLYSATLDEFTKATGIKVNALFSEQGLAERIRAEGENSPAVRKRTSGDGESALTVPELDRPRRQPPQCSRERFPESSMARKKID